MRELYKKVFDLDDLDSVAKQVLDRLPLSAKCMLKGEVGAGKTTLVKALLQNLGYQKSVDSPTFSLVNEYQIGDLLVYHFDLYRLKDYEELLDIGWESYLGKDAIMLVEWPEKALEAFDESWMLISMEKTESPEKRQVSIFKL